jgi:hypothetical protein
VRLFVGIAFAALLAFATECRAQAVIYADSQLANVCTNYDPATQTCGPGTNTAYPTLKAAANAATPGTTVLIRGGTYTGQLIPGHSGTPGNPITFQNYNSELVYLAFPGTHYVAIDISGCSNIILDGLHVEDTNTYWLQANNASYNIIRNCVFKHTPTTGTRGNLEFVQSDHNLVVNNDIEDGQDNITFIDSTSNLAEGNIIVQARHSIFGIRCGDFNILRSNYFSNTEQKIGEVYDCGVDTTAVPNLYNSTKHNVIEDNTFALTCTFYATAGGDGIQYGGQQGVIRRNFFYYCNTGIGMQVYGDESLFNVGNRIYNNVFYTNIGPGIATWAGATNNLFVNNILFGNQGCIDNCTNTTPGQVVYRAPFNGGVFETNDLLFQMPGQAVIEAEFENGFTMNQFTNLMPGVFLGTLEVNPEFVDATNFDFHLHPGSPMIDAGAFLTTAASSGSGTNLAVLDATYFCDGFGIPTVQCDVIELQGQTQSAHILRVDYNNNILTMDQPLTWSAGQGVALQFNGQAPDLGAFEFAPAPSLSSLLVQGNLVFSWPLDFTGYQLQSTTNLASSQSGQWITYTNAIAEGDSWVVTIPLPAVSSFFRLSK